MRFQRGVRLCERTAQETELQVGFGRSYLDGIQETTGCTVDERYNDLPFDEIKKFLDATWLLK